MQQVVNLYKTSIGKKVVMAVTGVILVGFVVVHMLGNLKLYQTPDKIDAYGEFLREVGAPVFGHGEVLWIARLVLLVAVVLHIVSAAQLTRMSVAARPTGYRKKKPVASTYASRTMRWGGVILALFVVYHILHFTTGAAHPDFEHGKVYQNVVIGFSNVPAALVYIVAMIFLGMHLYHGVWSGLQTLGVDNPKYNQWRRTFAGLIAGAVTAGNLSFPIAVLTGVVSL